DPEDVGRKVLQEDVARAVRRLPAAQLNLRERILEATFACIARAGFDRTTVEDAAREAGVSRATVYRWFPGGRDQLLDETIAHQVDQFFLRLRDEVAGA